ncbi:MAG: DUF2382 domain-containing protein [Alkalibacterium sp.]|nr:DUF2382 domain-containing protein [Alkalibacterium sp.]
MQNSKTVIGSYDSRDEALDVVHKLKNDGYQKQDIILYGNKDVANSIGDHEGVNVTADTGSDTDRHDTRDTDNDGSLWEQIKGAFSTDTYDDDRSAEADYNQDDDVLYPYRDDIKNGKIVVAVDNFRGEDIDQYNSVRKVDDDRPPRETAPKTDTMDRPDTTNDNDTLQLKEEKLDVDKSEVNTGEVNVRKEVKTETETVEVPVEKEEIVVERKPVSESDPDKTADSIDKEGETINIPVKEEQIEVNKRPVVKEEVDVRKETHHETKQVSEDVSHEELDVDTKGDVHVDDKDRLDNDPTLGKDRNAGMNRDKDAGLTDDFKADTDDPNRKSGFDSGKDAGL